MIKKNIAILFFIFCLAVLLPGKVNLSNTSSSSLYPQMVIDHQNNIHVVWVEMSGSRGDVYYIMYNGTAWTTPANISNRHAIRMDDSTYLNLAIDCDPNNNIYIIWNETNRIQWRTKSPTGKWHNQATIANTDGLAGGLRISVLDTNHVAVAWWTAAGTYSRARINSSWESIRRVNEGSSRSKFPDIHVGRTSMYMIWVNKGSDGDYLTKYSSRSLNRNAGWAGERVVYNDGHSSSFPRFTITSGKNIPYASYLSYHHGPKIFWVVPKSGGSFRSPEAASNLTVIHFPALYSRGDVVYAAWQEGGYENGRGIFYSINAGSTWGAPSFVAGSSGAKSCDVAATTNNSKAYLVWDAAGEVYISSTEGDETEPVPIPNKPPRARLTYTPFDGLYPLEVHFNASNSTDSDGRIVSYNWTFGDGSKGSGKTVIHTFQEKGSFTIRLTVTDDDGDSDSATALVNVYGLSSPINIKYERFENSNLFSIEYYYSITWDYNPLNRQVGANIVQYKIYRKETHMNYYNYFTTVKAKDHNEYIDRTLGRSNKQYDYTIVAVDIEGRESELSQSTGTVANPGSSKSAAVKLKNN